MGIQCSHEAGAARRSSRGFAVRTRENFPREEGRGEPCVFVGTRMAASKNFQK